MVININGKVLRKRTLIYLGLLTAGSIASQTDWVENHIKPLAKHHPHLAFLTPLLLAILTLLHNPQVANALTVVLQDDPTPPDQKPQCPNP